MYGKRVTKAKQFSNGLIKAELWLSHRKARSRQNEAFYFRPTELRVLRNRIYVRLLVGTDSRNIVTDRVVRDSDRNYRR